MLSPWPRTPAERALEGSDVTLDLNKRCTFINRGLSATGKIWDEEGSLPGVSGSVFKRAVCLCLTRRGPGQTINLVTVKN